MTKAAIKRRWLADYESWTFGDRAFLRAVSISVVWHLFWFFAVTIVVSPAKVKAKPLPRVVSLGAVLDDSIMRTLVETRPELSQTYYRPLGELPLPATPPAKTIERRAPGDVVSVPLGKRFLDSVKMLVGGDKSSPEFASRISLGYGDAAPEIEGELKGRPIISKPEEPQVLTGRSQDALVEIQFSVNAEGAVVSAEIVVSSGKPSVDDQWLRHVKAWEFAPLGLNRPSIDQSGRVRFHPDKERG